MESGDPGRERCYVAIKKMKSKSADWIGRRGGKGQVRFMIGMVVLGAIVHIDSDRCG